VNTRASHLAFAPFFVFSLAYSAVAYSTALGKEVLNETTLDTTRNCKEEFRIFVDVGHYRSSPGATSARGKVEFDFNLRLAQTLQQTLVSRGYRQVKLFVSAGGTQSLQGRTRESAKFKADILISIHHDDVQSRYKSVWNYDSKEQLYSDKFKGYSLFISKLQPVWPESLRLASLISDELLRRGISFTKHHSEQIEGEGHRLLDEERGIYQYDDLIVLKDSLSPAVLIEAGIIVNRDEELVLSSQVRRDLFSNAVSDAVEKFCVTKPRY
jgi:N-acetylmuramoyl-L-alanine amidase